MINNNSNLVDEITHQYAMKWESAFRSLLDDIYYPGYSQQLAEENPEQYEIEYYYFLSLYDEPLPVDATI